MAQLIKLQDYISRYETDIYHYPARFVRLKKQQWESTRQYWESNRWGEVMEALSLEGREEEPGDPGVMQKLKSFFQRGKKEEGMQEAAVAKENEPSMFETVELASAANLEELKQEFLNQLFTFQVKWASSTVREKSYIDPKYFHDERLRFFLQGLPDSFLLLYEPVLRLKNAPMELDVILLTPTEAWCLTFLEEEEQSVYIGSTERFWVKRNGGKESRVLSPVLAVSRMEAILKKLFQRQEIDFPIRKAIISRNGFIDYPSAPFSLEVMDSRTFPVWFNRMRSMSSPLKTIQLKAAKSVLDVGQTTSVRRPEWDADNDFLFKSETEDQEG
ncbi:NERD domain-containing protein [Bacillus aerolatus]|uniref:NERD domain-containing protein n=1 Tax=Bacillus aerolatus TaxID=2653354 RepID=A0A6I1FI07_9BACI|nr:nuclease-related domain-containing protein [Bacillus aerolatus]KAB7705863.1 NERD domain-containing protein [Bacillus aerolatus]